MFDVSKLVDIATAQYLKAQGFEEPRPKRRRPPARTPKGG
jgi:hypothetical protein